MEQTPPSAGNTSISGLLVSVGVLAIIALIVLCIHNTVMEPVRMGERVELSGGG